MGARAEQAPGYADELGITADGACGSFSFADETGFHRIHREWRRLMKAGLQTESSREA